MEWLRPRWPANAAKARRNWRLISFFFSLSVEPHARSRCSASTSSRRGPRRAARQHGAACEGARPSRAGLRFGRKCDFYLSDGPSVYAARLAPLTPQPCRVRPKPQSEAAFRRPGVPTRSLASMSSAMPTAMAARRPTRFPHLEPRLARMSGFAITPPPLR